MLRYVSASSRRARRGAAAAAAALAAAVVAARGAAAVPAGAADAERRVLALADAYVAAWFEREPLDATEAAWPAARHGSLPDASPAAIAAWQAREDRWLRDLRALPAPAPGSAAALARAVVL